MSSNWTPGSRSHKTAKGRQSKFATSCRNDCMTCFLQAQAVRLMAKGIPKAPKRVEWNHYVLFLWKWFGRDFSIQCAIPPAVTIRVSLYHKEYFIYVTSKGALLMSSNWTPGSRSHKTGKGRQSKFATSCRNDCMTCFLQAQAVRLMARGIPKAPKRIEGNHYVFFLWELFGRDFSIQCAIPPAVTIRVSLYHKDYFI
ncbi:hypothetical protein GGGNBK_03670 [Sporosarcina sp. ANT_H38]